MKKILLLLVLLLTAHCSLLTAFAQGTPGTGRYPPQLDTPDSLIRITDTTAVTTMSASITSSSSSVTVPSGGTGKFASSGAIKIDDEILYYTGKTSTTFTGLVRGACGTTAVRHNAGSPVRSPLTACHHTVLAQAIIAAETKIDTELVDARTTATEAILDAARGKLVTFGNAGATAVSIAQAGTAGNFASGWYVDVKVVGAGTVTITPATSTIDGAATLVLTQGKTVRIQSTGTNYITGLQGTLAGGGGGTPGGANTQVQFNDGNAFGGDPLFRFDKANGTLLLGEGTADSYDLLNINHTQTSGSRELIGAYLTGNPDADGADYSGAEFEVNIDPAVAHTMTTLAAVGAYVGSRGTVDTIKGVGVNAIVKSGNVTDSYGFYTYPGNNAGAGTLTNGYGVYVKSPFGTVTNNFAYYAADQVLGGSNSYFLWGDSPGVFRVKADGVMAYYNPTFTKYTPGATNYERIVQQWNSNVAEYGPEAGGTGTQRALRLLGNGLSIQSATLTPGGTTGAQTINKVSGTVNFAAAASSLVVTNSLVTTSSLVFGTVRTNDSTCALKNIVPGSGSFTITMTAACNAETSVGFLVINQ